jgi:exopolysaccharide production protein ExoQ
MRATATIAPDRQLMRDAAVSYSGIAPKPTFWLPVALVAFAVSIVDHSFRYASASNWAGGSTVDLVAEAGGSNLFRQLSFIAMGTMGAVLLLKRSNTPIVVSRWLLTTVLFLAAMIALSALWADDSAQALKRTMIPLLTMTAALGLAKHWLPRQICCFTAAVGGILLFVGIVAAIAAGTLLPTDDFRFAGTMHPNSEGLNCSLLCLASLALWMKPNDDQFGRRNWLWLVPFGIGLVFLLLTRSRTATTALAVGCCTLLVAGATTQVRMYLLGGLAFLACCAGLLLLDQDPNGGLALKMVRMGRVQDTQDINSLTGRVPIWEKALHDIAARPIFGYGYGGYWTPQRVWDYLREVDWQISHVHSVYLETMLNIGVVGLAIGLLIMVATIWSAMKSYRCTSDVGYAFIFATLAFALVHGLLDANFVTESFAALLAMICVSFVIFHGTQALPVTPSSLFTKMQDARTLRATGSKPLQSQIS